MGILNDSILNTGGSTTPIAWYSLIKNVHFNDLPPSNNTIAMLSDQTATIKIGMPIRFILGGDSTNPGTYYAQCIGITSNLLTIAGAPLETDDGDLIGLAYDSIRTPQQIDFFIAGQYADFANAALLASDMKTYFRWQGKDAYLVLFSVIQQGIDSSTEAKINVRINSDDVSTNDSGDGVQPGIADVWVDNSPVAVNTSNYVISRGDSVEINCTVAGGTGDGEDLTVSCLFVEE